MLTPFDHEHADPWGSHFLDLESLNAHVADRIAGLAKAVRDAARRHHREALRTTSLLVLGPAGTGKTHLFARLRRKLGPSAAFVHIRPDIGVATTPRHVLAHIIDALGRQTASLPARQLDVVLGCLVAAARSGRVARPLLHLDDHRRAPASEREEIAERIMEDVERYCPDLYPDYLEMLLALVSMSRVEQRAALAWLSGREPSESQLARLGRRSALEDSAVLAALRTLASVAAVGAPLVLVFDQLENLVDPTGESDRILAYGTLVSELRDSTRGLSLVQMALDTEWVRGIRPVLGTSQRTRVEGEIVQVAMPTPSEREALVRLWLEALPAEQRRGAFPSPFSAEQVHAWCAAADMTPRALMIACRQALPAALSVSVPSPRSETPSASEAPPRSEPPRRSEAPASVPPSLPPPDGIATALAQRLEALWEEQLAAARVELKRESEEGRSVSAERLAGALVATAGLFEDVRALARMQGTTGTVMLERERKRITILVVQQVHPRSVAVSLRRAAERADHEPVMVVRDRALPFKPSWGMCEELRRGLLACRHGAWLDLSAADLVRLLAVHDFLASARSQDVAGPDGRPIPLVLVRRWLGAHGDVRDRGPMRAALAMLDGRMPSAAPPPLGAQPGGNGVEGGALGLLAELRLASLERLVRETRARHHLATRASIEAELRDAGQRVRWFGASVVCMREEG